MNPEQIESFKKRLTKHLNLDLDLIINENRTTMLSVLERRRKAARLSIHRMFLDAPDPVISAVAQYVKGTRKEKREESLLIRSFIQKNLERTNYAKRLDPKKLHTAGKLYDLQEIYDEINEIYFKNSMQLAITWFGHLGKKRGNRITFGQYFDHLRLIKIHRMLDDPFFPLYFVKYVVFHEMVHHLVPGYVDGSGLFRCHGEEFKKKERLFVDYDKAIAWEKANKEKLFGRA